MESWASYEAAVEWVEGIVPFGMMPGLNRMELLLDLLGHPEKELRFIHVAGTNGKGSTCAFLTSILQQSGYRIGTFTSPCLERFTNRIHYNGNDIPEQEVLELANRLKPLVDIVAESEWGSPTMFDVTTCMALLYFAKVSPDFIVLEVGLGGRLDSTNVITPLISVITNIGHDHMGVLGDTLAQIAAEKAGIIKPGIPVVSAVELEETIAVIEKHCAMNHADLFLLHRDFQYECLSSEWNQQRFHFASELVVHSNLLIKLNGKHQLKNASVALMALELIKDRYGIRLSGLQEGLAAAAWAGRLEMVGESPCILLDGAHNPEGAEVLAQALKSMFASSPIRLLIGMLNTKEHTDYLNHVLPIVETLIITEPDFRSAMPTYELEELARTIIQEKGLKVHVEVELDWKLALDKLRTETSEGDLPVVSGTLYLISDVRAWILNGKESYKGW